MHKFFIILIIVLLLSHFGRAQEHFGWTKQSTHIAKEDTLRITILTKEQYSIAYKRLKKTEDSVETQLYILYEQERLRQLYNNLKK